MGAKIEPTKGMEARLARAVHTMGSRAAPYTMQLTTLAIFVGFLALRLPLRAEFLTNWDSVNYALGTELFSLEHHQPHPPGYIGYIALGWVLNHITGEANASFTLLSTISGSAAPAALFLLASHFMSRRYAAATAVALGLSPLVWYYSQVALAYSLEMALGLFFLWFAYRARTSMSPCHLLTATMILVLLGAIRQSGALFLMPLWLYVAWPFCRRCRMKAFALLVAGNLAWLVPLIWLADGPIAYIRASAGLASLAVAPTSVFAFNPLGLLQNVAYVAGGALIGVNVGLVIIALGHRSGASPLANLTSQDRKFFLLWLCPSLMTYLLVHSGQIGYILLVLPAGFLWAGLSLRAMVHEGQAGWAVARRKGAFMVRRAVVPVGLIAILVAANVFGSLSVPRAAHALAYPEQPTVAHKLADKLFDTLPLFKMDSSEESEGLAVRARQYHVRLHDEHWHQLVDLVEAFNPETTAVLAIPDGTGSFRHLTYYTPDYRLYGLKTDLNESYGHLFTAHNGTSDYSVEGLEEANKQLQLPDGVRHLVVPDQRIINRFTESRDSVLLELTDGTEVLTEVLVVYVRSGATLRFVEDREGHAHIVVDYPSEAGRHADIGGFTDSTREKSSGMGTG